jgi:hypothetical protein
MKQVLAAALVIVLTGCAVTEQAKLSSVDVAAGSGFLKDYSELQPGKEGQALLVYFNPNADWSRYDKVLIEPVTVGLGPSDKLTEQDQQTLSSYYYHALEASLSKDFALATQPGPDVMIVRAALTDATTATPVLRTISVIIPQARLLGAVKNMATGSYAFVGSAQSEGEVLDSMTGERLAAAVDRRSGGISIKNADVWEWGDAERAMDYWAQRIDERLVALSGAPGGPENFAFRSVKPIRVSENGLPGLVVKGEVVNVSKVQRRVPTLAITLLDRDNRNLGSWTFTVSDDRLSPGAPAPFQTGIAQLNAAATKLRVSLASDRQVQRVGSEGYGN